MRMLLRGVRSGIGIQGLGAMSIRLIRGCKGDRVVGVGGKMGAVWVVYIDGGGLQDIRLAV